MKVFLSWSGPRSKQVAEVLHDWLPDVIQAIRPWMSSEDIEKGSRGLLEIAKQLQEAKAGIVCVTPENQGATWLNFEAGAISKAVDASMVCTYLFHLRVSDLRGPLTQFQATEAIKADTLRLVATLNKGLESDALPNTKLEASFERCWPELELKLAAISSGATEENLPLRTVDEMVRESLSLLRDQARAIAEVAIRQHFAEVRSVEREKNLESRWAHYPIYLESTLGRIPSSLDSSAGGFQFTYPLTSPEYLQNKTPVGKAVNTGALPAGAENPEQQQEIDQADTPMT